MRKEDTTAGVHAVKGIAETFKFNVGARQEYALSTMLFNIVWGTKTTS